MDIRVFKVKNTSDQIDFINAIINKKDYSIVDQLITDVFLSPNEYKSDIENTLINCIVENYESYLSLLTNGVKKRKGRLSGLCAYILGECVYKNNIIVDENLPILLIDSIKHESYKHDAVYGYYITALEECVKINPLLTPKKLLWKILSLLEKEIDPPIITIKSIFNMLCLTDKKYFILKIKQLNIKSENQHFIDIIHEFAEENGYNLT